MWRTIIKMTMLSPFILTTIPAIIPLLTLVLTLFVLSLIIKKRLRINLLSYYKASSSFRAELKAIFVSVLPYIILAVILAVILTTIECISGDTIAKPPTHQTIKHLKYLAKTKNFYASSLICIRMVFVSPIIEETIFRGMLIPWINKKLNIWICIVISSILFSAGHFMVTNLIGMYSLIIAGLIFGWLFAKTKVIWPSIVLHIVMNCYSIC